MHTLQNALPTVGRTLLGLILVVFGLNGFFHFLPTAALSGSAGAFMGGLAAAGYFFPLLKATEIAVGALLLSGRLVALALVVLAPITINIVAFHALLAPAGSGLALLILATHLYLAWAYRGSFRGVLEVRARPSASEHHERAGLLTTSATTSAQVS
jgi:uncharacterized membrane protein YphA (DoxX/SURF4 family)